MHDDFKPKSKILQPDVMETEFSQIELRDILENKEAILEKLGESVSNSEVAIFIKGTGERPMCGYSKMMVEILKFYQVPSVQFVNVLESDVLRQTCKIHIFYIINLGAAFLYYVN